MDDRSGNGGAVADIEVFADVGCPFTHVGLLRFVEERSRHGREDLGLVVRAWPLEVVNGKPLDPAFIREEVDEIRSQLGGGLFSGFDDERGVDLGVVGSPHFLTGAGGFFCPALDVSRGDDGHLRVTADREGFDRFLAAALE